ncbi:hypothetical protein ABS71_00790 [bacterium SCN 62-11]|nr:MAG: hypothetical protein ABS71_00790 [bacterium SCN 62-11]
MTGWRRGSLAVLAIWLAVEGDIQLSRALRALPEEFMLLVLAVLLLLGHFSLWFYLLARSELSLLMPMTGLYYVFNAFLVQWQLGERLDPRIWLGTLLIAGGVVLVTTSGRIRPDTQRQPEPGQH